MAKICSIYQSEWLSVWRIPTFYSIKPVGLWWSEWPNEKRFIYRIWQSLWSEIFAKLYHNLTILKDWYTFFKAVRYKKSLINLDQGTNLIAIKPSNHIKEKLVVKSTENNHSYISSHYSQGTNNSGIRKVHLKVVEVVETAIIINEAMMLITIH